LTVWALSRQLVLVQGITEPARFELRPAAARHEPSPVRRLGTISETLREPTGGWRLRASASQLHAAYIPTGNTVDQRRTS
jgi:hypothetical protein